MGGKYAAIARCIHHAVNSRRESRDLAPLTGNEKLIQAAKEHARYLAKNEVVRHRGRGGTSPDDRVVYNFVGENAAQTYDHGNHPKTIANRVAGQWMQSPRHRRNLLNDAYTHSGIGVWKNGSDVYAVQMYAKPRGAKVIRGVKSLLPV